MYGQPYYPAYSVDPAYAYLGYPPPPLPVRRHSHRGIASFVIAVMSLLGLVGFFALTIFLAATAEGELPEDAPVFVLLGAGMIVGFIMSLAGIGLGIAGLMERDRWRGFALAGLIANIVIPFTLLILLVLGDIVARQL